MVILVTGLMDDPSPDGGAAPRAREMRAMRGAILDGGPVPLGPTAAHDTHRCHGGPVGEAEAPTLDHDEQMTEVKA